MKKIICCLIISFCHLIFSMETDEVKSPNPLKRKFADFVQDSDTEKLTMDIQKEQWQQNEKDWSEHYKKYCKLNEQTFDPDEYDDETLVDFFCFATKDLTKLNQRIIAQQTKLKELKSETTKNQSTEFTIQFNKKRIHQDNHECGQLTTMINAINHYLEVDQNREVKQRKK